MEQVQDCLFFHCNGFDLIPGPGQIPLDVELEMPENLGLGLANTALMDVTFYVLSFPKNLLHYIGVSPL